MKSSSHVVEEMISLSNVIKRQIVIEGHQRIILHQEERAIERDAEPSISYEALMAKGQNELDEQLQLMRQQEEARRQAFEQEREMALQEAKEQGYQAGYERGQQDGLDAYARKLEETNQFAMRLEQMQTDRLLAMEDELCVLSLQVTHHFLEKLHDTDEEALYQSIHQLIIQFRDREKIIVYTSAEDFERVVLLDERLHTILGGAATISLRIDPELAPRDFRIDSENGAITGGLTSSYEALINQVTEVLQDV